MDPSLVKWVHLHLVISGAQVLEPLLDPLHVLLYCLPLFFVSVSAGTGWPGVGTL